MEFGYLNLSTDDYNLQTEVVNRIGALLFVHV